MSDQSCTTPPQGETHQSVIPHIVSDSQETLVHRRPGEAASTTELGKKQARWLQRLICFTASAQEQNEVGNSL